MKKIIQTISALRKDKKLIDEIDSRIKQFERFSNYPDSKWFSELCYCLLTANSGAIICLKIQLEAEKNNAFIQFNRKKLSEFLRRMGYRFYNKRTEYIIKAREFTDIKRHLKNKDDKEAREFLVQNIKGLGWKESSHFLRNTGRKNVAIIDRHILRSMGFHDIKTLYEKKYFAIEQKLEKIAEHAKLNLAELDLYLWSTQTGKVLK